MEDDFLEMQYEDANGCAYEDEALEYERRDLDSEWWLCTGCDEHYNYCQCDD